VITPLLFAAALASADVDASPKPRLVVLIVVDQMRADYLDRFRGFLNGGLGRLRREGRSFAAARHEHAITSTGPGHASLASGSHPSRHGVVANQFRDPSTPGVFKKAADDANVRDLTRDVAGCSPRDLLVPALGDWMKAADPRSRVLTVAFKSRSAAMLGGHGADACVWVDKDTCTFTTSSYYSETMPAWIATAQAEDPVTRYLGREWTPRLTDAQFDAARATADMMRYEGRDGFGNEEKATFPHPISEEGDLVFTPFSDQRVLNLTLRGLEALELGRDDAPDLLGISFSSADYVGHTYGPESRELVDYYAWLDEGIGRLIDATQKAAGADRVLYCLSSDHGIGEIVESLLARGIQAGRVRVKTVLETVDAALDHRYGEDDWALVSLPDIYLSTEALERHGVDPAAARKAVAQAVVTIRGIDGAYPRERLLDGDPSVPAAFRYSFHPARSGDVMLRFAPHHHLDYLDVAPYVKANHATQYGYDQRIPVVFFGAGVEAGIVTDPFRSIDVAPTIAARLGIPVPAGVDGRAMPLEGRP